ncbi:hypothetical protein KSF78_0006791 [Schistosoma japonicum]|nr:hypothetical protein KSF78_0006791 [Schistosoma japonicum]
MSNDDVRFDVTASEQWNPLLKKPTFMNQDTLKTECINLLQETSLNETSTTIDLIPSCMNRRLT